MRCFDVFHLIRGAAVRIAAMLCAVLCASAGAHAQIGFYAVSDRDLAGPPGSVIRMEPMIGAPLGASAHRVLYRSTGLNGEPIAVSGVIVVPPGPAPAGGRPVVAWAHPTTGVVPRCAPSLALFVFQQIQGLREMVQRGYIVVATDYPGLGTAGPHPYLVGVSGGRAVLDSVRAVRQVAGINAGAGFVVWGHSQGGQAALYTGLLARGYAPDLNLLGVAAAAPASELATLLIDDLDTPGGKNLTAMTLWSWTRVFGAPLDRVLDPAALPIVDRLAGECLESVFDLVERRQTEKGLERGFLVVNDLTRVEPWRTLLARNTPGPLPPGIPIFVAQGTTDNVVIPDVTLDYVGHLCRSGSAVQLVMVQGVGHGFIARDSAPAAIEWMADRFAGRPVPSTCRR